MSSHQQKFDQAQDLRNNGKIEEAIDLYSSIRESALAVDKHLASECLHMIGVAHYQTKNYDKAKQALEESKTEFEKQNNLEFAGFVLRDLGMNARNNNKLEESKEYLEQSIQALHKSGNKGHEGISKVKLGVLLQDISLIDEGIRFLKETKEVFFLSSAYFDKAKILKDKDLAKKSLEILDSFATSDQFLERRKEIAKFLTGEV